MNNFLNKCESNNDLSISVRNGNDFRRLTDYSFTPLMFHREKENSLLFNVRIQTVFLNTHSDIIFLEENQMKPAHLSLNE